MTTTRIASEHVFMRLARACLSKTARFLQDPRHQVRNSGSPGCHQAAQTLAREFRKVCGNASVEEFWLRPKVLWYVGRVVAVCGALGAILSVFLARYYGPGWTFLVYVGTLLCVAALCYALVAYVFFSSALDWLFRRRPGYNVVAHLEPAGPSEQQVVLVGHHDSQYAFWFLQHFGGSPGTILFVFGALGFLWTFGYSACLSGRQLVSGQLHVPPTLWSLVTLLACVLLSVLYLMFMHEVSPGAGDNLNSSFMALTLARYFAWERRQGRPLKRTRLILLSTDGEELGQRGAKAYVRRHLREMDGNTSVLIMDTIVHPDDLMILRSDRNGTVRLSSEMVSDICTGANWLGIPLTARWVAPGAGGTDAAPFAAAGITTTAIIGTSMAIWSWGHEYHTTRDHVPTINVAAVRDTMMIAADYIRRKDA